MDKRKSFRHENNMKNYMKFMLETIVKAKTFLFFRVQIQENDEELSYDQYRRLIKHAE